MFHDMFHLPIPLIEKIVRPIIVYILLVLLLRLFGKRELAQLNPFDLVVLLMLSNTVQNAIIGDDNSLAGGMIGAIALLVANFALNRVLYRFPKLDRALQGSKTVLVQNGRLDRHAMKQEMLTREELLTVIHKQNITGLKDVKLCVLEPNGTFLVESTEDSFPRERHEELLARMDALQCEMKELKQQRTA